MGAPHAPIETDAVIVGAGPVGLFQVFELGLLEIKAHVIDSLAHPGGQCAELYPDKPIYDIPAVAATTGAALTQSLMRQIEPFGASLHMNQEVSLVAKRDDGRFDVQTSTGTRFIAHAIVIAAGVGSFRPRELKVDGLEKYLDTQLFYQVRDPAQFAGKHIVIVGGGDSAVDWALHFAQAGPRRAASVTLLHRRDHFNAAPAQLTRMRELCAAQQMRLAIGQVTGIDASAGRLRGIQVTGIDGEVRHVALDALLVFFGLSPKLGPIANWGVALARKQIVVDTEKFETSVPGVFAVGDVNTYPGKKKLILCGFHEAALASFGVARYVFPDRSIQLQYTTTSTRLHQVLGVASPTVED